MNVTTFNSSELPTPRGHMAVASGLAWIRGQMPMTVSDTSFNDQAGSVLDRLDLRLAEAGTGGEGLVSVQAHLADAGHWADTDPRRLPVAAGHGQDLAGTLLTIVPGLNRHAVRRTQIAGGRMAGSTRGCGLGALLLRS